MATVGTGEHAYELVENWAQLPKGWVLGQTTYCGKDGAAVTGPD